MKQEEKRKNTHAWDTFLNWFDITVRAKKTEKQLYEIIDKFSYLSGCEKLKNKLLPIKEKFPSNTMLKRVWIRLEEKRQELEKIEIEENEKRIQSTIELRDSLQKRKEIEEEERRIAKLKREYRDFQTYKTKFENGEYDEVIKQEENK